MLISDKKQQQARTKSKSDAILNWLMSEKFSDLSVIAELLETGKPNASKALSRLEKLGLVAPQLLQVGLGKAKVWTLTQNGMGLGINPADPATLERYTAFEPSRIAESTIMHQLACQKLRLQLQKQGWTHWISDQENHRADLAKIPDGLAVDSDGLTTAVELERSFKSRKRYQQILGEYLAMLSSQKIHRVAYYSPDSAMPERLEAIFKSIKTVSVGGRQAEVKPEWLTRFTFNFFPM